MSVTIVDSPFELTSFPPCHASRKGRAAFVCIAGVGTIISMHHVLHGPLGFLLVVSLSRLAEGYVFTHFAILFHPLEFVT